MQVKVLGSAAAEGWPALFCECEHCKCARIAGGKDIRRRTSYLLNGKLLVDMGPDLYMQDLQYDFTRKLEAIVITHTHIDHYSYDQFDNRHNGMSLVNKTIDLAGNEAVFAKIEEAVFTKNREQAMEEVKLRRHLMTPGDTVELAGMKVSAILANHGIGFEKNCLNYVFSTQEGSILIANDTGWWSDDSWEFIKQFKLDIVFIDTTCGLKFPADREGHMGVDVTVEFRDKLLKLGCINSDSQVFANHFSHNSGGSHKELCAFFETYGIGVAYDGMEVSAAKSS